MSEANFVPRHRQKRGISEELPVSDIAAGNPPVSPLPKAPSLPAQSPGPAALCEGIAVSADIFHLP